LIDGGLGEAALAVEIRLRNLVGVIGDTDIRW
jgi:hypothetical protein